MVSSHTHIVWTKQILPYPLHQKLLFMVITQKNFFFKGRIVGTKGLKRYDVDLETT